VNTGLAPWLIFEFVFSLYFVFLKFWVRIFFFVFLKLLIRIFFYFVFLSICMLYFPYVDNFALLSVFFLNVCLHFFGIISGFLMITGITVCSRPWTTQT